GVRRVTVEAWAWSVGDLGEGLPHADHVKRWDSQVSTKGPCLDRRGVVGDRLQREVGRDEIEALAGQEVPGDRTVEPATEQEHTSSHHVKSPRILRRPRALPPHPSRRE